jgi:hypothetical protein
MDSIGCTLVGRKRKPTIHIQFQSRTTTVSSDIGIHVRFYKIISVFMKDF